MRHQPIVCRAALLLALCSLLLALCPFASAQFTTNVWPSWEWQFQGKAHKDQAIAAINERCQVLGVSELSFPQWFLQHKALYQIKQKIKTITPSFVDPLNYSTFTGAFHTLTVTGLLARVGAQTNYLDVTPWFDLAANSNGWRYITNLVGWLRWTATSADIFNGDLDGYNFGEAADGLLSPEAARASIISNLSFSAGSIAAQRIMERINSQVGSTNWDGEAYSGTRRKGAVLNTTNFTPYGPVYFYISTNSVSPNPAYFEPFDFLYSVGWNEETFVYGLTNRVMITIGSTNVWPAEYWPDFPAAENVAEYHGWEQQGTTHFLLKWDGTNGFKYR